MFSLICIIDSLIQIFDSWGRDLYIKLKKKGSKPLILSSMYIERYVWDKKSMLRLRELL